MKRTLVALAGFPIILAGCFELNNDTVSQKSFSDICFSWAVSRAGNAPPETARLAYEELKSRGVLSTRDLNLIAAGKLLPGMSERAAICVWGGTYSSVNTTLTAQGETKQFISRSDYRQTYYFYTRNGVVTSVQNWPN